MQRLLESATSNVIFAMSIEIWVSNLSSSQRIQSYLGKKPKADFLVIHVPDWLKKCILAIEYSSLSLQASSLTEMRVGYLWSLDGFHSKCSRCLFY